MAQNRMVPHSSQPTPNTGGLHSFAGVPVADIHRSVFDLSHHHGMPMDAGYLYPCYSEEIYPGDTFAVGATAIVRMPDPLFRPMMDDLTMDVHYWFVPRRLTWSNWAPFMGEQPNAGIPATSYTVPKITSPSGFWAVGSLPDYFGWPVVRSYTAGKTYDSDVEELRDYNLIYNTWYRDQNLIDAVPQRTGDTGDLVADYVLLRRGKRHDYFTSSLPYLQKGVAPTINLGGSAPVLDAGLGQGIAQPNQDWPLQFHTVSPAGTVALQLDPSGASANVIGVSPVPAGSLPGPTDMTGDAPVSTAPYFLYNTGSLVADLSTATGFTLNVFRQFAAFQQFLELNARGGTRLIELIHAHFGVVSPDARMQRPEFLGSQSFPVQIMGVPQTAPASGGSAAAGNLTAYGFAAHSSSVFHHSFTEHGYVIGIASIRSEYTYHQGLRRDRTRQVPEDFYWPVFANLGEQPVQNIEILTLGTSADQDAFGFQERWAELRYHPSILSGVMRPGVAASIGQYWTLAQDFGNSVSLSQAFVEENPPVDNLIAVTDQPQFIVDFEFHIRAVRPLPTFSVPGLTRI